MKVKLETLTAVVVLSSLATYYALYYKSTERVSLLNQGVTEGFHVEVNPGASPPSKPLAVLHVGPHKTGTTTVQRFLAAHRDVLRDEDGFVQLAGKGHHELGVCLNQNAKQRASFLQNWLGTDNSCENIKNTFVEFIASAANNNRSIVVSTEEFDRRKEDIGWLRDQLESSFNIRIVLYYRHFFDWLGSYISQKIKGRKPGNEYAYMLFSDLNGWLEDNLEVLAEQHTFSLYQRYSRYFDASSAIVVLDFHDVGSPVDESFACLGLPGATRTCALVRADRRQRHSNPRKSFDWIRIEEALPGRGYSGLAEEQVAALQAKWEVLRAAHPNATLWMAGEPRPDDLEQPVWRRCVSHKMLDRILTMSHRYGEGIAGTLQTTMPVENRSMEKDFMAQVPESFCALDAQQVIDHWERHDEWFSGLKKERPAPPNSNNKE